MTEQLISPKQAVLPRALSFPSLNSPWMLGSMVFAGTLVLGFGWTVFPFDIQMVWTMVAQAILFSLALSVLGMDLRRLWKTKAFMPRWYVPVFVPVWVAIGLADLQKAYECMRVAGQL
uniref:hypothetical protein n=1 Tax=Gluconobacter thailandicus TaxID=257438 RepID=UPI001E651946|nr:hypothetical protein [Gluconobacter thailandicus]